MVFLCVILLFPSVMGNHAQLEGGSDAGILMSTLAYGWVERCSDIASSRESYSQDKYFLMYLSSTTVFVLNYYEHDEFLNE